MKRYLWAALFVAVTGPAIIGGAGAEEFEVGDLTIDHPWARETAATQANGAAYFTMSNAGDAVDRLVGASAEVAERVELHTHSMEDGVMRMREVAFIEVPANGETDLAPGGLHLMLLGLRAPLVEGETFPLTLEFEQAGLVELTVSVEDVAGPAEGEAMDHDGHDHGGHDHGDHDHSG